jgi:hypothetical protein
MSVNPTSGGGGGSSGSGGSGGGGGGGPCGACKFLRRKCVPGCIFAPYFDSEQGAGHFAAVHKVFGASNVSKLLLHIPVHKRLDAVVTICYEAQARLRDPVYGCVAHIFALQQQVRQPHDLDKDYHILAFMLERQLFLVLLRLLSYFYYYYNYLSFIK